MDASCSSDMSHKTSDMATSPIKFVALSPTTSLMPSCTGNSSCQEDHDKTKSSVLDGTENLVPEIEFSYSDISEKSQGKNKLDESTASSALTSVSERSVGSVTCGRDG